LNCTPLDLVQLIGKPGDTILDVAAAQGNFSIALAKMGYHVTWNDIREELSEYVRLKNNSAPITYKPGNVFDVRFDQLFDIILATEIIEHVAHPDEFLANLAKLLKPGGYIIISTPLGSYFRNNLPKFSEFADPSVFESKQFGPNSEDHIFLFHLDEVDMLAQKSGLKVIKTKYYTNVLTNGHFKLSILLKILPKKIVFAVDELTKKLPVSIGNRLHTSFVVLFQKSE
jgi:2-polyprenyl-6-hydroxyphenyl methylase/3-demethylubiquinone-9 3-methyltransferase